MADIHWQLAGRIPNLHKYVGKEGQGLKAREYHTRRWTTVKGVLETSMVSAAQHCLASADDMTLCRTLNSGARSLDTP